MKGCICHFTKWQIHPLISKGTISKSWDAISPFPDPCCWSVRATPASGGACPPPRPVSGSPPPRRSTPGVCGCRRGRPGRRPGADRAGGGEAGGGGDGGVAATEAHPPCAGGRTSRLGWLWGEVSSDCTRRHRHCWWRWGSTPTGWRCCRSPGYPQGPLLNLKGYKIKPLFNITDAGPVNQPPSKHKTFV